MKLFKQILSIITATIMFTSIIPVLSAAATEINNEKFQYVMFADGTGDSIQLNTLNLSVNGDIYSIGNVSVVATYPNINGTIVTPEKTLFEPTEYSGESMIYIHNKIINRYFTSNVVEHEANYNYSNMNININNPICAKGDMTLSGNISLNSSISSLSNIKLLGETKNSNNSVIYSKYGDITIEGSSTSINGLIYAPFGSVHITSQNVNINGIIIAREIIMDSQSININYNNDIAKFVGNISEELDLIDLIDLPSDKLFNSDEDELPDIYEKIVGTDPFNPDTDNDGLTDYQELFLTGTAPLKSDTDGDGISDGCEDEDEDGLTNLQEIKLNIYSFKPDSDMDGISDGDEVNLYKTDPLNSDTDGDGISDFDEITLGLDPNSATTNGTPDNEYIFNQTIASNSEMLSSINGEGEPYKLSIDINAAGNAESNLKVCPSEYTYSLNGAAIWNDWLINWLL